MNHIWLCSAIGLVTGMCVGHYGRSEGRNWSFLKALIVAEFISIPVSLGLVWLLNS